MKTSILAAAAALALSASAVVSARDYTLKSPDGRLQVAVAADTALTWSISRDGTQAMAPSRISLTLADGTVLGARPRVSSARRSKCDTRFATPLYRKDSVADHYNQLSLKLRDGLQVQIRAYNDAAAYRLVLDRPDSVDIATEGAEFNFGSGRRAWLPLVNDLRDPAYPYSFSMESYYDLMPLGEMPADTLSIVPALIELDGTRKALVMEGQLTDYPGMFLRRSADGAALQAVSAPLPTANKQGGFNRLNLIPTADAGYIARVGGRDALPWRAVAVTDADTQLPDLDLAMLLAEPSCIADTGWIKPGKVAWDWWNDWGITGVDFEAGINTPTYKHYIDYAADHDLRYVILDEGWALDSGDIYDINPDINLQEIIDYARDRGVGIILWATWRQLKDNTAATMDHFASMGISGFKVDFFDRIDQEVIRSTAEMAQLAAERRLLLDLHGMRPIGLQRTWPNVVNYEGVKGLENYKWGQFGMRGAPDQLAYDVEAAFIRMAGGPLDYTPGAMTNSTRASYRPSNDAPMSLGTRAHQVAMYTIYDGALQMLADSPTAYSREPECAAFMAAVPTVWDETVVLDGRVGEYIAVARRSGDTWYVAAMTNAAPRTLSLDTSFLTPGADYELTELADGVNAVKHPTDHRIAVRNHRGGAPIEIRLAPGGGYTGVLRSR